MPKNDPPSNVWKITEDMVADTMRSFGYWPPPRRFDQSMLAHIGMTIMERRHSSPTMVLLVERHVNRLNKRYRT